MIKDVEFHDVVDQRFLVRLEIGHSHRDISSIVSNWICRCESIAVVSILDDLVDSIDSTEKASNIFRGPHSHVSKTVQDELVV